MDCGRMSHAGEMGKLHGGPIEVGKQGNGNGRTGRIIKNQTAKI